MVTEWIGGNPYAPEIPNDKKLEEVLKYQHVIAAKESTNLIKLWLEEFRKYLQSKGKSEVSPGELNGLVQTFKEEILQQLGELKDLAIRDRKWKETDGLGYLLLANHFVRQQRAKIETTIGKS